MLKSKGFKLLLIAIVVVLGIMLYSASTSGHQNFITAVTSFITTPIQKLSAMISGGVGDFGDSFTDIETIQAENALLLQKVRELTSQMVDYEEVKQENERLKKLLDIKEDNEDFKFAAATVISRDASDEFYGFIIDKGSLHGVEFLDPVITEDGLVGYVSQLGPISSKVTTIFSPSTDVGAIDRRTLDGGVLSGDSELAKNGFTKLSYLQRDCDVTAGDIIVTSGLGGIYPKNLIIGEVSEIKAESQDISLYAVITPLADITACTDVYVITYFDGQGA
ncbi:MAG: rod shape-determining protein MreC, partial [Clostridia bacterium]|nr:rod shape-determining protein MreC [Clostridia bacterium]